MHVIDQGEGGVATPTTPHTTSYTAGFPRDWEPFCRFGLSPKAITIYTALVPTVNLSGCLRVYGP